MMNTDPIMFWQAVLVLVVLGVSIVYNIVVPSKKK